MRERWEEHQQHYLLVGLPTRKDAFPTAKETPSLQVTPSSIERLVAIPCTAPSEHEPILASAKATIAVGVWATAGMR